ncbi:MAG: efflux RND transporter periplasmic adaptor subunit [Planctomycetota bacterium]
MHIHRTTRLCALIVLAALTLRAPLRSQEAPVVHTERVQSGSISRTLKQSGVVTPHERLLIYSRVSGFALSVGADLGDDVAKGKVLAEIDVPELRISIDAKRAAVDSALARIDRARAQAKLKHTVLELTKKLSGSELQRAQAEAEHSVALAEVKLAQAEQKGAVAALEGVQQMLEYSRVRAPFGGRVTRRLVHPGTLVRNGTNRVGTALFELQRVDRMRCRIDVPEKYAALVARGHRAGTMSARLTIPALELEITLSPSRLKSALRVAGSVHPETHHMTAEIDLEGSKDLIPGLSANVEFSVAGSKERSALIPNAAVRATTKGKPFVFIVTSKSTVRMRPVKLGATNGRQVEVLEGLTGNENVVVRGFDSVLDGQTVREVRNSKGNGSR